VPFDWHGQLLFAYGLNPHEIIMPDLNLGRCHPLCDSTFTTRWHWGEWRGGTPALLVDGEYLAFFHSSIQTRSPASKGMVMHHYYMGAYSYAGDPPFAMRSATREPIVSEGFYTYSSYEKRVIFPGGFAVVGSSIYVAYGKDDNELWIATLDKAELKKAMKPIRSL
jgi:predicted GH43/DUF377 family glycosyl hydrolase